jgi:hypothetical protein
MQAKYIDDISTIPHGGYHFIFQRIALADLVAKMYEKIISTLRKHFHKFLVGFKLLFQLCFKVLS